MLPRWQPPDSRQRWLLNHLHVCTRSVSCRQTRNLLERTPLQRWKSPDDHNHPTCYRFSKPFSFDTISFSRACCRHGSPSAQGKVACLFPISDFGAVVETKAPLSMLHERCIGKPLEIHRKRRNCTKAVPVQCVSGASFLYFLVTRPKRRSGAKRTLLRAGNLYAPPQEPFSPLGETPRSVSHSTAQSKRILKFVVDSW